MDMINVITHPWEPIFLESNILRESRQQEQRTEQMLNKGKFNRVLIDLQINPKFKLFVSRQQF